MPSFLFPQLVLQVKPLRFPIIYGARNIKEGHVVKQY